MKILIQKFSITIQIEKKNEFWISFNYVVNKISVDGNLYYDI